MFSCFLAPALAQINGSPIAAIGWNPNDPANSADGHPAALTHLSGLRHAIIAPDGLVVFADGSHIRRIAADGAIHTLLTDSRNIYTKLAADNSGNIYYIANTEIYRLSPDGSTVKIAGAGRSLATAGLAATDSLIFPQGLTVDSSGNLLFSDNQTRHVFRIDSGGVLRVVAGTGVSGTSGEGGPATAAQLTFPLDLGFDAVGNLMLVDGGRLLRIKPDGTLQRLNPNGLTVGGDVATFDSAGNAYFTGAGGFQVSRMTTDGAVTPIAGNGALGFNNGCGSAANPAVGDAKTAGFERIVGLALDTAGNLLIAEQASPSRLRLVTPAGQIRTIAGAPPSFGGDGGPASAAFLDAPHGLAFDSGGALYLADTGNHRIRKVALDGTIQTVAGQGGPTGDMIYNCSGATANSLNLPESVAVDAAGNLYIADTGNNRLMKLAPDGTLSRFAAGLTFNQPRAVGVDAAGAVWVGDNGPRTLKLAKDGAIATILPGLRARSFSTDAQGNFYLTSGLVAYRVTAADQLVTVAGLGIPGAITPSGTPPVLLPSPLDDTALGSGLTRDGQGVIYNIGKGSVDLISAACHVYSLASNAAFNVSRGPWHMAANTTGDVYLTDFVDNVVWRLPHLSTPAGELPTPALSPGVPVFNAASLVVTSVDSQIPIGSGQFSPARTLQADAVAPGELVRIYGQCIGPFQPVQASYDGAGRVSTSLGGVQLTIGGVAAPLVSVQEGMAVAQTPFGMSTAQTVPAVLTFNGVQAPFTVTAAPYRPGLFAYTELDGSQTALAVNQDGGINSQSRPAPVGSIVAFFGTGLGQTAPGSVDGVSASDITRRYLSTVQVTIGGNSGTVTYAGVAPGFIGMSQINVTVPPSPHGANAVQVLIGGAPFRQPVQIWVQ